MKQLTQDKRLLAVIGVVVLLLLVGLYFFLTGNKSGTQTDDTTSSNSDSVQNLKPEDVGLTIEPHTGNKCTTSPTPYNEVRFVLNKASGIKHVDWEITYDADVQKTEDAPANANSRVTQQIEQESDVNPSAGNFTSHYDFLGTCSAGVCRCDTGVNSMHYVIKIDKNDGKTYKVEADKQFSSSNNGE